MLSADDERGIAIGRRIRTGTFSVNGGNYFSPDVPFGGYKQSGIGREMGAAGLAEFLAAQGILGGGQVKPLEGVRVVEVAMYGFVPSAGAVLADWGADVIKIEHAVTGDPQRGLRQTGTMRVEGDPNPNVEHANRGKRSLGLDMSDSRRQRSAARPRTRRRRLPHELPAEGHVPSSSIDVDDIRAVNPKIIYARGSALGPRGIESDKGGYDMTAFWARAGVAATLTPAGTEGMIAPPGPAFGDTISGTNLAGGIAAALFKRERTGEPSVVDVSLLGSGVWAMGHDDRVVGAPRRAHGGTEGRRCTVHRATRCPVCTGPPTAGTCRS